MRAGKKSRTPATPKGSRKPARRRTATGKSAGRTTASVTAKVAKNVAKKPAKKAVKKAATKPATKPASRVTEKHLRNVGGKQAVSRTTAPAGSSPKSLLKMVRQSVTKIVKTALAPTTHKPTDKPVKAAPPRAPAAAQVKGASGRPAAKAAPLESPPVSPVDRSPPSGMGTQSHNRLGSAEPAQAPGVHPGSAGLGGADGASQTDRGSTGVDGQFSGKSAEPAAAGEPSGGDTEGRPPLPVPIASFTI